MEQLRVQQLLEDFCKGGYSNNASVYIITPSSQKSFVYGHSATHQPYFIASITKLYINTLILQLVDEQKLRLDDPIERHLEEDLTYGIHQIKGVDYTDEITISHLLSHQSGLFEYFESDSFFSKSKLYKKLISNEDVEWTTSDVIKMSRSAEALYKPGQKTSYSDINYHLLAKITESICDKSLADILNDRIIKPLALKQTYLFNDVQDKRPLHFYFKNKELIIPHAMKSFWADGGMVSTAYENAIFLKAYYEGVLFNRKHLSLDQPFNRIFFPFQAGLGHLKYALPKWLTPFQKQVVLYGHPGLTGAFAFYYPAKQSFLCGSFNQLDKSDKVYRFITKVCSLI